MVLLARRSFAAGSESIRRRPFSLTVHLPDEIGSIKSTIDFTAFAFFCFPLHLSFQLVSPE